MGKRGNPKSNWSNWSDKGQHREEQDWGPEQWDEQDWGSQHRSTQPWKHSSSSSAVQPAIQRQRHTAEQSGGGQHWRSQHWDKQDGTPPHHPKPKRVHTPALIKLEAGDVTSASGMVLQAHLTRGLQLEQDMKDAKLSFETAQTSRAASIAATCQAESLTLPWYQNPTVVNLAKQRLKRRAERRHLKQCFRKGRRWRQPRR